MAKSSETWTKLDGTKILVDDMSEGHLRNTLKMIIRNRERRSGMSFYDAVDDLNNGWLEENDPHNG